MIDQKTANKLRQAGVDSSIILSLMLDEDEPEQIPAPDPVPDPEPAPAEPSNVEAAKAPAAAPDPVLAAIEKLTGTVASMQAAIQAGNLKGRFVETPAGETTDDILKGLFTKPNKEV